VENVSGSRAVFYWLQRCKTVNKRAPAANVTWKWRALVLLLGGNAVDDSRFRGDDICCQHVVFSDVRRINWSRYYGYLSLYISVRV